MLRPLCLIKVLPGEPSPDRLRFIEAVVVIVVAAHATSRSSGCRLIIEIGRATGLFR